MAYITLMDRDFHFFHNMPCRMSISELKFDTQCPEPLFNAEHPYRCTEFRFQSDMTILDAFRALFEEPGAATDVELTSLDLILLGSSKLCRYFVNLQPHVLISCSATCSDCRAT